MEDLIVHGNQAFEIVVLPTYKIDERLNVEVEDSHPPEIMFMGLGWHRDEIEKLKIPAGSDMEHDKHYRQFYNDELEKVSEIFNKRSPFNSFDLKRG